jgi:tryptophan synthase alpha subunit
VAEVGGTADGVIVGSRLVRAVEGSSGTDGAVAAVSEFLAEAREALSRG